MTFRVFSSRHLLLEEGEVGHLLRKPGDVQGVRLPRRVPLHGRALMAERKAPGTFTGRSGKRRISTA